LHGFLTKHRYHRGKKQIHIRKNKNQTSTQMYWTQNQQKDTNDMVQHWNAASYMNSEYTRLQPSNQNEKIIANQHEANAALQQMGNYAIFNADIRKELKEIIKYHTRQLLG
jgi:hypothetical protein